MAGPVQFSFANALQVAPHAHRAEFGGGAEEQTDDDAPFVPAPRPTRVATKTAPKASQPINVLALAKARLKEVKKELVRLKALEKERDELERLISAAEQKPRAKLVSLPHTSQK